MENNKQILTITDAALNRVKFLMKKTDNNIVGLRVGIKTAGCSGLKYNIEYAKEVKPFEEKVLVDAEMGTSPAQAQAGAEMGPILAQADRKLGAKMGPT